MLTVLVRYISPSQLAQTPIESVFLPLLPLVSPGLRLAISGFVAVAMFLAVWLVKRSARTRWRWAMPGPNCWWVEGRMLGWGIAEES